jgi:hypothetical protein
MFGWLRANSECPVDPETRAWIDRRWVWLESQFGAERSRKARLILPRREFFPDRFDGQPEDARTMLDRVAGYMGLDPAGVELCFYQERKPAIFGEWTHGTAGLYQDEKGAFRVWIEAANLSDPLALVGTIAHELGHVHLLGHGRITDSEEDHEPLTDLLTVFLGLGIFTANSVIREKNWLTGNMEGWSVSRRGYLGMPEFGYAFALFARARGEDGKPWSRELRLDVRSAFNQAMRFLSQQPSERADAKSDR